MAKKKPLKSPISFQRADLSVLQSAFTRFLDDRGMGGSAPNGISSHHPWLDGAHRALDRVERELTGQVRPRSAAAPARADKAKDFEECLYWLFRYALAKAVGHEAAAERYANKYKDNQCDPDWLEAVFNYVKYYWLEAGSPHYVSCAGQPDCCVYGLPEKPLTVGILGDWGTGQEVAGIVLDQLMAQKPDVIIHIGDIYYSGTWEEGQDNFLRLLTKAGVGKGKIPLYNLPGNHDYYSGGTGFYRLLPMLNADQSASFWCLRNKSWQLQGMDTGYYDHDLFKVSEDMTHLHPSERDWHRSRIKEGHNSERKVILFSHHQFCSALSKIGGYPFNQSFYTSFKDLLPELTAWFWGHEHLLEIYAPYKGLQKGRCVGYSAFPVTYDPETYTPKMSDPELLPYVLGQSGGVFDHGFVVLTLGTGPQPAGIADYYSVPGDGSAKKSRKLWSEPL